MQEIKFLKSENEIVKANCEVVEEKKEIAEKNNVQVSDYCTRMRKKFKNVVDTVSIICYIVKMI